MRKMPSLATLEQIHDADHGRMRAILKATRTALLADEPGARSYVSLCYSPPSDDEIRMHCLNDAARTHGVESIKVREGDFAEYLNTGETYAETLILWRGNFRVQSVGDFVEMLERNGIQQTWNH